MLWSYYLFVCSALLERLDDVNCKIIFD